MRRNCCRCKSKKNMGVAAFMALLLLCNINSHVNATVNNKICFDNGKELTLREVKVISPQNNQTFKPTDEIVFQLSEKPSCPLRLTIVNNKDEVVFSTTIKESLYKLKQKLSLGLYYWKLETDEDVIFVGKFFIK